MKAEEQILELLTEVLRKQDQMHGQLGSLENKVDNLEDKVDNLGNKVDNLENKVDRLEDKVELLSEEVQLTNERLNVVIQTQQAHQQVLRTLATEQQRQRGELEGMRDSVDAIARMQRDQNRRLDRLEHPGDFV